MAVSIRSIARRRSSSLRSGRSRIWISAAFLRREQVGEARLRHARGRRAAVEHERGDEARVVDARDAGQPVAQRRAEGHVLRELRAAPPRRRPAPAAPARRADRRAAARACAPPRPPGAPALRGLLRACENSSPIWLTAVLMNVAGPYTTFAGLSSAISRHTGGRLPSPCSLSGTLPDRQPSSRSTRPRSSVSTVRASSPLHQHQHGLVAEVPLEALGRLEALRAAVHERVGGGARLQPQRQRRAAERQQRGEGQHQQRPTRDRRHDASERVPPHAGQLRSSCSPTAAARSRGNAPALADQAAERRLRVAGRRRAAVVGAAEDELVDLRRPRLGQVRVRRRRRGGHRRVPQVGPVDLEVPLGSQLVVAARRGVGVRAVGARAGTDSRPSSPG